MEALATGYPYGLPVLKVARLEARSFHVFQCLDYRQLIPILALLLSIVKRSIETPWENSRNGGARWEVVFDGLYLRVNDSTSG